MVIDRKRPPRMCENYRTPPAKLHILDQISMNCVHKVITVHEKQPRLRDSASVHVRDLGGEGHMKMPIFLPSKVQQR